MRAVAALCLIALAVAAGCGGTSDSDIVVESQPAETPTTTPSTPATTTGIDETAPTATSSPLPAKQRDEIAAQAADTAAAIGRWDEELAACTGLSGSADDADATCTHAAWGRLVFQADLAVYYLLGHMRDMPRGSCHSALSLELDAVRGFWQGGAPLDLAWLDEQQRPPSLYDLETSVALIRPVPSRIRHAVSTVCAP